MRPIKAPRVDKVQSTIFGDEANCPKLLIPLYPSTKWGVRNPKIHQYWREKDIKAKEKRLLSKAVPKSGGPWSEKQKYESPQSHQAEAGSIKPVNTGKGSSKGHQLKIIKVIHKAEKKMGDRRQYSKKKSAQKEGWKHKEDKEVQTQEIHHDQTPEKEGIEPPPKTAAEERAEEDEWEICETAWETEGKGNQQGNDQGPWSEEELWYQKEAGSSGEGYMEDTEGEE